MMNNKLPPSYGAIENNVPPPKYREGPSNETTIEIPPFQNENQQTQVVEVREKPSLKVLILALFVLIICFYFLWWLFSSHPRRIIKVQIIYKGK